MKPLKLLFSTVNMFSRDFIFVLGLIGSLHNLIQGATECDSIFNERTADFISRYTDWRGFHGIMIIDKRAKACSVKFLKNTIHFFNERHMYIGMLTTPYELNRIIQFKEYKSIVSTFYDTTTTIENIVEMGNEINRFPGDIVGWLIVVLTNKTNIFNYLRFANFAIDTDIVVALPYPKVDYSKDDDIITINHIPRTVLLNYTGSSNRTVFNQTNFCPTDRRSPNQYSYCIIQAYKARRPHHSTVTIRPLGLWNSLNGSKSLRGFAFMELRTNFYKQPLIAGIRNSTKAVLGEETIVEDDDLIRMQDFYRVIVEFLNATEADLIYTKLGIREPNGEWSDLLGAVTRQEVDVGVDNIIRNLDRNKDMVFLHDILSTMRNIYLQPERSNEVRDIFKEPFAPSLILCVLGTGIIFSIILSITNNVAEKFERLKPPNTGFLDSIIWCVGIYSQQGTIMTPRLYSGRIIIILSLAFSLLIYNSYSAFITSILSVELMSIRSIDDLLHSDYQIGYIRNSQDEAYLRSTNISELNQIYLRGYLFNNISNITEGLLKVIKGNYGFFASEQIARKELLTISEYKCRYEIDEIPIRYTKDEIAFAVSRNSPYKRLLNLCIIRMHETGVFKYLLALINPQLLKCDKVKTHQSARLSNLLTAFSILIVGLIGGIIFGIIECLWFRRVQLYRKFKQNVRKRMMALQPYAN